jgi:cell division protein FtsI (penicillin-binding protein 3)
MSEREARLLTRMLVGVTEPGGTGTRARVPGFTVAGKTGTAQKVLPGGGYSQRDYISSFVGFLPAEDPKVAVLVVIDTPRGAHYGGTVAGPAFSLIARAALAALGVYERTVPVMVQALAAGVAPDLRGLSLRQVVRLAGRKGLKLSLRGWGRVVEQRPEPGRPLKGVLSLRLAPGGEGA